MYAEFESEGYDNTGKLFRSASIMDGNLSCRNTENVLTQQVQ